MSALRIVFAGTPEFAAQHLQALLASRHRLVAVYTQPDRPAGRGKKLAASPVKQLAERHGLPVYQPASLKGEAEQAQLAELQADVMVVVAYGLLLPKPVLDIPRHGCLNVHASLLPRWRGAAPIQRAIEAGDGETGVTIMQMDVGLDTGAMLRVSRCAIAPQETAASLHDKLARLGCPALLATLDEMATGRLRPVPQDHAQANYAHKLSKAEAQIDWRQSARDIDRRVRAFNPFPVCFTLLHGERLRIWAATPIDQTNGDQTSDDQACEQAPGTLLPGLQVACGRGVLAIHQLQLEGKKVMTAAELLAGYGQKFAQGARFDPAPQA